MATSKVINLYFSPTRYTATISSDMDDDTLYQVFRATIAEITDPSLHIIVTNKRGEKVQLHYESLHSGALYYIATSSERMQGAGTSSTAASKTARFLDDIAQNWGFPSIHAILPFAWAQKEQDGTLKPLRWAWRFAQELRLLSGFSKSQHVQAVSMLVQTAEARLGAGESGCVTTGDVKKVVTAWKAKEQADKQTYAGGLAEHLPEVEDEGVEM